MSDTAHATVPPVRSSPGKGTMRTIRPAAADGLSSALQIVSWATSTSTMARIRVSSATATDYFNSLLEEQAIMNVTRGLWRAWIFITVLWVIGTAWAAYVALPDWVAAQRYQYVEQMKQGSGKPWEADWTKDYYELMRSPSKEHLTPEFSIVDWQHR